MNEREVAGQLMEELRLTASWLELDRIEVTGRGDLGPSLQHLAGAVSRARCLDRQAAAGLAAAWPWTNSDVASRAAAGNSRTDA